MARLVHLSDLHFGRERFALVPRLIEQIRQLAPHAVVISGDLTQHSRVEEYESACKFITGLPMPVLAVPGNRDLSPWNMPRRLLWPYKRWKHYIHDEVTPVLDIAGLRIIGLNSTDPYALHRGRLNEAELDRACTHLANAPKGSIRIIAMHHPFYQPSELGRATMYEGANAAQSLAEAGAEIILCGHLHHRASPPFALLEGRRKLLNVESGSTLATAASNTDNRFNLLEITSGKAQITTYSCSSSALTFAPHQHYEFRTSPPSHGWLSTPPPQAFDHQVLHHQNFSTKSS